MGSLGLAVALTLRGRQHRGPLGRRAGGAVAKISTALGTLADTDEALAADPAIPAATEGRTQLPCSPDGSDTPRKPISRKYVTRLVLRRRSSADNWRSILFPQDRMVKLGVYAPI